VAEVYFYIPSEEAENAVECGVKLSRWYGKEVPINGEIKRCISALMNPKDDMVKYKSDDYKCLKMELQPKYCHVADNSLYQVGMNSEEVMEMYNNSIKPLDSYIFGQYRFPECLISSTAIPGQVAILDRWIDTPILFNESEELYISNLIQINNEEIDDFNDAMLYSFYCKLAEKGKIKMIEDKEKKIAVFSDKTNGKVYITGIPDLSKI